MRQGVSPDSEAARGLATHWISMLEERVDNDPMLMLKLHNLTSKEGAEQERSGITTDLIAYITAAITANRRQIFLRYLTAAEVDAMDERRKKYAADWPSLITELRGLMERGADASDPEVRAAVQRWQVLFDATMSGGDQSIRGKLQLAYAQEPELLRGSGIDADLINFIRTISTAIA